MAESSLIDPKVIARLHRVPVTSRLPMSGNMTGQHKSPHRGASVEFAEYRKYVPGDDIRMLDWRVYARSDRFYLKEFEADTNLRAYFLLDCSGSMAFESEGTPKFELARRMIATLAYLVVQQGDAAGLACIAEKLITDIPPRRNPAHLRHLFTALEKCTPSGKTKLPESIHTLAEKIPQRALVLLFSDCFTDPAGLIDSLEHLRFRKHDIVVFHMLDRVEIEFEFSRPTRFLDLESSTALLAEPEMIRRQYLDAFSGFVAGLKRGCQEHKVEYRRVVTDEDYEKVLARFMTDRTKGKK